MKAIELTEEHKSKLLEMCRVLFPEYDWSTNSFNDGINQFAKPTKTLRNSQFLTRYHWFEFCMTKLVNKLYDNEEFNKNVGITVFTKSRFLEEVIIHHLHPIDYLYKEFKKLN